MRPQIHIHEHGRQYVDIREEHHEHRAPTDESIKLLREIEKDVHSKTISVHRLKNNAVDAVWHIRDQHFGMELIGHCRLILNGKEIEFEINLERGLSNTDQAKKVVAAIIERISMEVATKLFMGTTYQTRLLRS